jgi:hypothetical protein
MEQQLHFFHALSFVGVIMYITLISLAISPYFLAAVTILVVYVILGAKVQLLCIAYT